MWAAEWQLPLVARIEVGLPMSKGVGQLYSCYVAHLGNHISGLMRGVVTAGGEINTFIQSLLGKTSKFPHTNRIQTTKGPL